MSPSTCGRLFNQNLSLKIDQNNQIKIKILIKITKAVTRRSSIKKAVLKNLVKLIGKIPVPESRF